MSLTLGAATSVFLALISHHWIESFALGVSLQRSHCPVKATVKLITFFASMAPLGIVIGISLSLVMPDHAAEIVEAVFVSIAAGSFIYVASVDILLEEFHTSRDKHKKVLMFLVGFLLNAGLTVLFESLAATEDVGDN